MRIHDPEQPAALSRIETALMGRRSHHGRHHGHRYHRDATSTGRPGPSTRPASVEPPVEVDRGPQPTAVEPAPSSPLEAAPVVAQAATEPANDELVAAAASSTAPRPNGGHANGSEGANGSACTVSQLRRFIKSRAYVPMHELRRRFMINGGEDDVSMLDVGGDRVYLGLPAREADLLGELLRQGDVGYELSMDPVTPIVVGVYPMRPVPRP